MELKEIYELWDRFESSSVSEFELDLHGAHVAFKKPNQEAQVRTEAVSPEKAEIPAGTQKEETSARAVKAPLVGTFYRAGAPGEKPFVTEGQEIHKGDVIGIIEAMKLMNEVTSTEDGIVTEISAADGQLVEYDQVLLLVR